MPERAALITAFLEDAGWGRASREPLAGDASARRYERLHNASGASAVLMDAPACKGEDVAPFLQIATHLRQHGFSAPEILAADRAKGLVLLEDLGDDLFARICTREPAREDSLYRAAVDLLLALQALPPPPALGPYDRATYLRESRLLCDWYLPAATGAVPSADLVAEFDARVAEATESTQRAPGGTPGCLVLRDYHAENLIWLPDRQGLARVGLLDFQDALIGHPVYDLVSLLEDARRDTPPDLREAMKTHHRLGAGLPAEAFEFACAALAAQRNIKIIGIFARLWLRDGKPAYLDMIPRVWGHLLNDLSHPSLASLKALVARHVPAPDNAVLQRIRQARDDA